MIDGCPECGGRAMPYGIVIPEVYDGVLYWCCPACGFAWPRWWEGPRAAVSARFAAAANDRREDDR